MNTIIAISMTIDYYTIIIIVISMLLLVLLLWLCVASWIRGHASGARAGGGEGLHPGIVIIDGIIIIY